MSFSNYTSRAILNALFGKTSDFGALASVPAFYIGLSSTTPTAAGGNVTEPATGGYARVATLPADWAAATDADPSSVENVAIVDFGTASASWGAALTHVVAFDDPTAGNMLAASPLAVSKSVAEDDPVTFPAGALAFTQT
jgi:hypothetical protein